MTAVPRWSLEGHNASGRSYGSETLISNELWRTVRDAGLRSKCLAVWSSEPHAHNCGITNFEQLLGRSTVQPTSAATLARPSGQRRLERWRRVDRVPPALDVDLEVQVRAGCFGIPRIAYITNDLSSRHPVSILQAARIRICRRRVVVPGARVVVVQVCVKIGCRRRRVAATRSPSPSSAAWSRSSPPCHRPPRGSASTGDRTCPAPCVAACRRRVGYRTRS